MARKKKEHKNRGPTLGASYRAASTGAILASPALYEAKLGTKDPAAYVARYRMEARDLAVGTAVHVLDNAVGEKLLGHNAALGRKSLTAWGAEAIPTIAGVRGGLRGGAGFGTAAYSAAKTGYSTGGGVGLNDDVRNYGIAKYGLGAVRKLSGMGPLRAVSAPLKSFLGSMGVSL